METSEFRIAKRNALRRKIRNRAKIVRLAGDKHRIVVFRSNKYFYSQVLEPKTGNVVISASTAQKSIKETNPKTWGKDAVKVVGDMIGNAIKAAKINDVVFDRGQYIYLPGSKIAVFADAVREKGVKI